MLGAINPLQFIFFVIALLVSLSFHEASHAFTAYSLGDPTAKNMGRLSLNPIRHLDPLGTVFLVVMAFSGFGIGWAKPVPVNPHNMRMNPKTGMAVTALAGPVSNMVLAAAVFLLFNVLNLPISGGLLQFANVLFIVNISLAAFNLIPIPPLDGFSVLLGVLPNATAYSLSRVAVYGPMLLLVLIMFPGVLSAVLRPLMSFVQTIVTFGTV